MPGRKAKQKPRRAWGSCRTNNSNDSRGERCDTSCQPQSRTTCPDIAPSTCTTGRVAEFRSAFTATKRRPKRRLHYSSYSAEYIVLATALHGRIDNNALRLLALPCMSLTSNVYGTCLIFSAGGGRGENHSSAEIKKRSFPNHTDRMCLGLSRPCVWCTEHNQYSRPGLADPATDCLL